MNPALSVLFFTTLSGAGLGLLLWLGAWQIYAPLPLSREFALAPVAAGMTLLSVGLAFSFFHLGRPLRAWRAFSQWRSSWLSREAVTAVGTLGVALGSGWLIWRGEFGTGFVISSAAMAMLALLTLIATSGIYTSLKPIRAWNNGYVLPFLLLAALLSGGLLLWLLLSLAMWELPDSAACVLLLASMLGAGIKTAYWRFIDQVDHRSDTADVTGLAAHGRVRPAESPHTEHNYLLREMGYVLARRHGRRLRAVALVAAFALPAGCVIAAWSMRGMDFALALLAFVSVMFGLFVERWLFFAQARHVVTGYYRPSTVHPTSQ